MGVLKAAAMAAAAPTGIRAFTFSGRRPRVASENGSDAGADLDGRAFASEGDAAGESDGSAKELSENGAEGDAALAGEESGFGLRNAAAARVREIFVQEITDGERSGDGNTRRRQRGAAGRIESHADAFGDENESNDGEAGEDSDDEGQDEEDLIFARLKFGLDVGFEAARRTRLYFSEKVVRRCGDGKHKVPPLRLLRALRSG